MTVLGIDQGNSDYKTSNLITFPSKASTIGNLLNSKPFIIDSQNYYIGDGSHDPEYRKTNKKNIKPLFLYAIFRATQDTNVKVVTGLPLSQYKQDKDQMKHIVMGFRNAQIVYQGVTRKIIIDDCEVYPEGVSGEDGVHVDIGGGTIDVCLIENKRVVSSFSIPLGTLKLYINYINMINSKYGLDLKPDDAPKIIDKGLSIDGVTVDISFTVEVFKAFVEDFISALKTAFSLSTNPVKIMGGGGQLLFRSIKNRIPQAKLAPNPIFANAQNFYEVGVSKWL